ncbi:MAG: flagellar basal body L-ring protein FlgH [Erythrobacter sp.]
MKSSSLAAALGALALAGCMGGMEGSGPRPGFASPPPPTAPPPAPPPAALAAASMPDQPAASTGAIFQASQGYVGLHVGARARNIGDMLTIVLVENTTTQKSASGQTGRDGSFGITPPATGPLSFLNPEALKAASEGSFRGQGNAAQQSRLNGAIAVTIAAVYPNGTADVIGEKQLALSQGEEWVQFAGRVRLIDVDANNRLFSNQVANARMIYAGKGAIQQASRPGWLSRFFGMIAPF